jgi:hypothetical protein
MFEGLTFKEWFGFAAVVLAVINYLPYLIGSLRGSITPHLFTWALWFILTSVAFYAQLISGGGIGAWATGTTALIIFLITIVSLRNGFGYVRPFDYFALGGALSSIVLWVVTNDPFWSVILISFIHSVCFLPTFRKGYGKPNKESVTAFVITILKYGAAIIALETYAVETVLFPATIMTTSLLFISMITYRRSVLRSA